MHGGLIYLSLLSLPVILLRLLLCLYFVFDFDVISCIVLFHAFNKVTKRYFNQLSKTYFCITNY